MPAKYAYVDTEDSELTDENNSFITPSVETVTESILDFKQRVNHAEALARKPPDISRTSKRGSPTVVAPNILFSHSRSIPKIQDNSKKLFEKARSLSKDYHLYGIRGKEKVSKGIHPSVLSSMGDMGNVSEKAEDADGDAKTDTGTDSYAEDKTVSNNDSVNKGSVDGNGATANTINVKVASDDKDTNVEGTMDSGSDGSVVSIPSDEIITLGKWQMGPTIVDRELFSSSGGETWEAREEMTLSMKLTAGPSQKFPPSPNILMSIPDLLPSARKNKEFMQLKNKPLKWSRLGGMPGVGRSKKMLFCISLFLCLVAAIHLAFPHQRFGFLTFFSGLKRIKRPDKIRSIFRCTQDELDTTTCLMKYQPKEKSVQESISGGVLVYGAILTLALFSWVTTLAVCQKNNENSFRSESDRHCQILRDKRYTVNGVKEKHQSVQNRPL